MKKNALIFAALILLNIVSLKGICQTPEGEITYSMSMMMDQMPDMDAKSFPLLTMKFKGDKEVMTMGKIPGMSAETAPFEKVIYDLTTKQVNMLMDKDGKKYDLVTTQDEMADMWKNKSAASPGAGLAAMFNPDSLKVNYVPTDSVVTIMGYKCRKYTATNSMMKLDLYASDSSELPQKLANSLATIFNSTGMQGNSMFNGVKGFTVKTVVHMNAMGMDMTMVMAVSKVSFKKVSDSEFEIPKDYEKITYKDLQDIESGNSVGK